MILIFDQIVQNSINSVGILYKMLEVRIRLKLQKKCTRFYFYFCWFEKKNPIFETKEITFEVAWFVFFVSQTLIVYFCACQSVNLKPSKWYHLPIIWWMHVCMISKRKKNSTEISCFVLSSLCVKVSDLRLKYIYYS